MIAITLVIMRRMSRTDLSDVSYDALIDRIAEVVRSHAKGALKALLFGSVARREADPASDVDILLVWPPITDEDTLRFAAFETANSINSITNRRCIPLIFSEDEYLEIPKASPAFADALSQDAIDLLA